MLQQHFKEKLKHKIVKPHLGGRALKSLEWEYGVSKDSISNWVKTNKARIKRIQRLSYRKLKIKKGIWRNEKQRYSFEGIYWS